MASGINYKKIKSIIVQLEILGKGKYDDEISKIQSKLTSEPYTATDKNVIFANSILTNLLNTADKKDIKRLGKYFDKFEDQFYEMDNADDFINSRNANTSDIKMKYSKFKTLLEYDDDQTVSKSNGQKYDDKTIAGIL